MLNFASYVRFETVLVAEDATNPSYTVPLTARFEKVGAVCGEAERQSWGT